MGASAVNEVAAITKHYEIGDLAGCERIPRGFVNVSYRLETMAEGRKTKYLLRKYKQGITEEEIRFEHSLVDHLVDEGFDLVAAVIRTKDGGTFVKCGERQRDDDEPPIFYAIFEWLEGEDRYTWDDPPSIDEELRSAGAVLAQYHRSVQALEPKGRRVEPRIHDLLPEIAKGVQQYLTEAGETIFDAYFLQHGDIIQEEIERTLRAIRQNRCDNLTELVIHCDYAPGNLKFRDSQVIGLYDFDWSKVDVRVFDVALALVYFCTTWEPTCNGDFIPHSVSVFLNGYQSALTEQAGAGPLNDAELECLPHMIAASNIYVLNWALEDFYGKDVDAEQYLRYLRHHVNLIHWLGDEANWNQLTRLASEAGQ